ncbi:hypothetical protein ANO11243_042780 [Dothideomycetidae sp. 11243]|nr:hypothetical protein ANO11243_042780 [fungal sp. No.11243]
MQVWTCASLSAVRMRGTATVDTSKYQSCHITSVEASSSVCAQSMHQSNAAMKLSCSSLALLLIPSLCSAAAISSSSSSSPFTSTSVPSSTTTTTTTTSSIPTSSLCPSVNAQTLSSGSSSSYTITCSSDSSQGAYASATALTSYLDCMALCDASSLCTAFVYVGGTNGLGAGTCWLKTVLGTATPSAVSTVSCPASNGTIYTSASGSSFIIECGIDRWAGDMFSVTAAPPSTHQSTTTSGPRACSRRAVSPRAHTATRPTPPPSARSPVVQQGTSSPGQNSAASAGAATPRRAPKPRQRTAACRAPATPCVSAVDPTASPSRATAPSPPSLSPSARATAAGPSSHATPTPPQPAHSPNPSPYQAGSPPPRAPNV